VIWKTVELGDVCKVIAGQSPESVNYNKEGIGLAFYQGKKDFGEVYINPPTVWTNEVTKEAIKNDILMSVRAPVGPVNIATEHICIGRGLAAIRATDKINQAYLFYYLLKIEKELVGNAGAVFNSINKTQIENLKVPLPSLSTQQKIVAKLDAIFTEIDTATATVESNVKNAEALFQSYLTKVFESLIINNKLVSIKDICDFENGDRGKNYPSKKYQIAAGIPFINAGDLQNNWEISRKGMAFISKERFDLLGAGKVKNGDLLFCLRGSLGKCGIVDDIEVGAIASSLVIIRPKINKALSRYLYWFLTSSVCLRYIKETEGGTAQPNLSAKTVMNYKIPLISCDKQIEIIKLIDGFYQYTNTLKNSYQNKTNEIILLKQSILKKAFSGELVKD
jgi:type I restriction enzyme S subunit